MKSGNAPVISLEDVRLGFGADDILRGVSFRVEERETKVLIGESGSGKTLSLKLTAGLLKPTAGRVQVLGNEVSAMRERELLGFRRQMGFVFQEGALFDSLTVGENVGYRLIQDKVDPQEIEQRVRQVLRFVELENTFDLLPADLSGGMRRRVAIARAVVTNPPIVLYDSPTAGLDPITSQTIIELILRLRDVQGITAVLVTHRLQDAFGLANYRFDAASNSIVKAGGSPNGEAMTNFVVLRGGEIYYQGSAEAVLESKDSYLKSFLV